MFANCASEVRLPELNDRHNDGRLVPLGDVRANLPTSLYPSRKAFSSSISVLREVADGGAVNIAPMNAMAWAQAADRRTELQARELLRAASFTFDASARRFLEICAGFDQVRAA